MQPMFKQLPSCQTFLGFTTDPEASTCCLPAHSVRSAILRYFFYPDWDALRQRTHEAPSHWLGPKTTLSFHVLAPALMQTGATAPRQIHDSKAFEMRTSASASMSLLRCALHATYVQLNALQSAAAAYTSNPAARLKQFAINTWRLLSLSSASLVAVSLQLPGSSNCTGTVLHLRLIARPVASDS